MARLMKTSMFSKTPELNHITTNSTHSIMFLVCGKKQKKNQKKKKKI